MTRLFFPSGIPSHAEVAAKVREHEQRAEEARSMRLGAVEEAARSAGVTCTALHRSSDNPWEEIIKVAKEGPEPVPNSREGSVSAMTT